MGSSSFLRLSLDVLGTQSSKTYTASSLFLRNESTDVTPGGADSVQFTRILGNVMLAYKHGVGPTWRIRHHRVELIYVVCCRQTSGLDTVIA